MNIFIRVKNDCGMLHISCSTISPSHSFSIWETGCEGLQWKTEQSRHSAPQWSITVYACRVMNTFQLLSRPLTQGHVRTVALGPLRKLDSYSVTVLRGLYFDTNTTPPVRWRVFFWNALLIFKVFLVFLMYPSKLSNQISHLKVRFKGLKTLQCEDKVKNSDFQVTT